ncbi:hypothetical protein Hsero_2906 [Herbaspirillum seropedicae SmR1]|uniref:Uncharacterized protein n=1 Tax=Herbaspirillum seropedicae (strain SmR1) TaxID=757424 RepID=D8IZQ6_HERSS|nr:hypothetical protein Hsero_2906 [Herbaspirillum seropedicae SmR1]
MPVAMGRARRNPRLKFIPIICEHNGATSRPCCPLPPQHNLSPRFGPPQIGRTIHRSPLSGESGTSQYDLDNHGQRTGN